MCIINPVTVWADAVLRTGDYHAYCWISIEFLASNNHKGETVVARAELIRRHILLARANRWEYKLPDNHSQLCRGVAVTDLEVQVVSAVDIWF